MQGIGGRAPPGPAWWQPFQSPAAAPRYLRLADGLRADVGRAIAMAAGGALAFAPLEYALATWAYPGAISLATRRERKSEMSFSAETKRDA